MKALLSILGRKWSQSVNVSRADRRTYDTVQCIYDFPEVLGIVYLSIEYVYDYGLSIK